MINCVRIPNRYRGETQFDVIRNSDCETVLRTNDLIGANPIGANPICGV